MGQLMRKFLTAYIEWVDAGAPECRPFSRRYGLCVNLTQYPEARGDADGLLIEELCAMFRDDGLSDAYPFGRGDYYDARREYTQHRNNLRNHWVRSKLAA